MSATKGQNIRHWRKVDADYYRLRRIGSEEGGQPVVAKRTRRWLHHCRDHSKETDRYYHIDDPLAKVATLRAELRSPQIRHRGKFRLRRHACNLLRKLNRAYH